VSNQVNARVRERHRPFVASGSRESGGWRCVLMVTPRCSPPHAVGGVTRLEVNRAHEVDDAIQEGGAGNGLNRSRPFGRCCRTWQR
jgi:hypothetical protein